MVEPSLPFFIEWAPETELPGTTGVEHTTAVKGIKELIVEGDQDRFHSWLVVHQLPVTVRPGSPAWSRSCCRLSRATSSSGRQIEHLPDGACDFSSAAKRAIQPLT
jgi:hypothetical protein